MDEMIDRKLVKQLRNNRAWSQDQLASVSGLSHRTIQRIENEGRCSLDSKMAIAAAFDVNTKSLETDTVAKKTPSNKNGGYRYGILGAGVGLISAYTGITISLVQGHSSYGEAGIYYGSVGAFCGISCAIIGILNNKVNAGAI